MLRTFPALNESQRCAVMAVLDQAIARAGTTRHRYATMYTFKFFENRIHMLMFQLKRWILFYDILIDMCSYPLHPLNFLIFCRKNPDHHDSRVAMGVRHGPRATQKQQNRYMPRAEYMRKYGNSTSHDEDVPESPTNAGSTATSPASPTYDAPTYLQLCPTTSPSPVTSSWPRIFSVLRRLPPTPKNACKPPAEAPQAGQGLFRLLSRSPQLTWVSRKKLHREFPAPFRKR